jgi:chorismate dehydratase
VLTDVKQVSLDVSSLTSANLLRCLLAEFHGLHPSYVRSDECDDPEMPRLLIGNHAIEFRRANGAAFHYLDLGAEWNRCIGLPFVYALWLIRPGVLQPKTIADELRRIKAGGLAHISEIIRDDSEGDAVFREHYLRNCIRYSLCEPEKSGMRKFHELLVKHGLLQSRDYCFNFV